MFYASFWVVPRRVNFMCRRFETICLWMEQTECSETSAYEIQTPGNYPEESIQYSEHGKSLKSRSEVLASLTAAEFLHQLTTISLTSNFFSMWLLKNIFCLKHAIVRTI